MWGDRPPADDARALRERASGRAARQSAMGKEYSSGVTGDGPATSGDGESNMTAPCAQGAADDATGDLLNAVAPTRAAPHPPPSLPGALSPPRLEAEAPAHLREADVVDAPFLYRASLFDVQQRTYASTPGLDEAELSAVADMSFDDAKTAHYAQCVDTYEHAHGPSPGLYEAEVGRPDTSRSALRRRGRAARVMPARH